jgi:hypothetical protein
VELQNADGDVFDWDLHFYFQPANSPDRNINNFGFFVSIQALQYQHASANIGELIPRDLQLYQTYSHGKTEQCFLNLADLQEPDH